MELESCLAWRKRPTLGRAALCLTSHSAGATIPAHAICRIVDPGRPLDLPFVDLRRIVVRRPRAITRATQVCESLLLRKVDPPCPGCDQLIGYSYHRELFWPVPVGARRGAAGLLRRHADHSGRVLAALDMATPQARASATRSLSVLSESDSSSRP